MNGGVQLRTAGPADAGTVATIWHSGWREAHLGHVPRKLLEARTSESFRQRAVKQTPNTIVAIVDGEIAGFVMVIDDEVEPVYVSQGHRGTRVATELLTAAERKVQTNGHARAWLAVVAGNPRARRFYERNGWSDEGLFEHQAPAVCGPISVPAHRYIKQVAGHSSG